MTWEVFNVPDGWVRMRGRDGCVTVPLEDVPAFELLGYWREGKLPKAQDAPGDAVPMDTGRGMPRDDDEAEDC